LCFWLGSVAAAFNNGGSSGGLTASGFIASDNVRVAPEISGKVLTIDVAEGDSVQTGDVLFSIDDELLQAQAEQARAAVDLANASVEAANAQLSSAQVQYDLVVQQARLATAQQRATAWATPSPADFEQPNWYYGKSEQLAAAQAEVDAASQALSTEQANLSVELKDASNEDFVALEKRLAEARLTYQIAEQTLQQAQTASDRSALEPAAQDQLDAAKADLDTVQMEYDRMLSSEAATAVLDARAHVAVAQNRLDVAMDTLAGLQTGVDSLQVKAAQSAVTQAEKAVTQAEANLIQAQSALNLIDLQLKKCVVTAPSAGTVLSLNFKAGEVVSAGSVVLTLGSLEELNLTVYVPEDQYGQIRLGQEVSISVDSFPDQVFKGQVQYISDEAEFTPRNVQTVEGRKSTVFAVKISVPNTDQALKPGMPADVDFNLP
jgi:HlyD family secretion protein